MSFWTENSVDPGLEAEKMVEPLRQEATERMIAKGRSIIPGNLRGDGKNANGRMNERSLNFCILGKDMRLSGC